MTRTLLSALALVLALGCGDDDGEPDDAGTMPEDAGAPLTFTGALTDGSVVPARHKCPMSVIGTGMGENLSPPLAWTGVSAEAQSLALVLFDTRYRVFHWALWDIPPATTALPEGIPAGFEVSDPPGARQGGGFGDDPHEYFGPCSDAGATAGVYEYRLHELSVATLDLGPDATGRAIADAIDAASIRSVAWEADPE